MRHMERRRGAQGRAKEEGWEREEDREIRRQFISKAINRKYLSH